MAAKHAMVIADADYAGTLTRSKTVASMPSSAEDDLRTSAPQEHWLRLMARSRSRTVLASGDLQPVLRDDGSGHSLFANHLLHVLVGNDRILEGSRLFRVLAPRVRAGAAQLGFEQEPEYSPIRFAGDVGAPFLFVPVD